MKTKRYPPHSGLPRRRGRALSAFALALAVLLAVTLGAIRAEDEPSRLDTTIVLDEVAEANLSLETLEAEETVFRQGFRVLGRIEEIPARRAAVSSRISGRVVGLETSVGEAVEAGETLVRVESRQPGTPPPVVELKAPLGGLVMDVGIRLGTPVDPDSELIQISDLGEVWAVAQVPELHAARIAPGTVAEVRVPALGSEPLEGTFVRFGVTANRATGTLDAVFILENEALAIRPGMQAEFFIVTGVREDVTVLPREAIQGEPAARHVYIRDYELDHAFVRLPVVLGESNGGEVEILSGLFPGDEVVVRGAYSLAFAGKGSVSLKEALDAAHGHPHNEDGSEMTAEQLAAKESGHGHGHGDEGHGHGHGHAHPGSGALVLLLSVACGVLLLLLALSPLVYRRRDAINETSRHQDGVPQADNEP